MAGKRIDAFFDKSILYLIYLFIFFSLFTIAGTQTALALIVVIWGVRMLYERQWTVLRTPVDKAFLFFVLACVVATLFSLRPLESLYNLKNVLLLFVVYTIASNLRQSRHIDTAMNIFIFTATLMAAIGILTTDLVGGYRVMSFQSTTMTWGAMSTIFILITLALFLFGRGDKMRWLYLGCFVIQLVSMLFSYVRGSWLGFMAGIFIMMMIKSKKLIAVVFLLLVVLYLLAPASVQNRILSITDMSVGSTQVRFTQWKNSIDIFLDHPITGVGWIDLSETHKKYAPDGADMSHQAYNIGHFHNNYVMFYVCLGGLGFIAALYLIFRLLKAEYRIYRQLLNGGDYKQAWVVGSLAAMTGFWVNGFFDWTFGDAEPVTLLWFSVGMVLAIKNHKDRERETNSS